VTTALLAVSPVYAVAIGPLGSDLPDNPFGLIAVSTEVRELAGLVGTLALFVAMALAVVAIAVRWRRGSHVERSQLKWLFAALVVAGLLFPTFTGSAVEAPSVLTNLSVGSALLIPVAIGIAILRYRLYEIDRLISRTISYGVVSATLVAVYASLILVLQGPLGAVTGGDTVAVAASTLVAAALFQPVRRLTQSLVDHRFNRARYDAERTIDTLASRLRGETDLPIVRSTVIDTVVRSVEPTAASLWLRLERAR
jgi:hypothetical protein